MQKKAHLENIGGLKLRTLEGHSETTAVSGCHHTYLFVNFL